MVTGKTRVVKDELKGFLDRLGRKLKHTDATVTRTVQKEVNRSDGEVSKGEANNSLRMALGKSGGSDRVKKSLRQGATDIIRKA